MKYIFTYFLLLFSNSYSLVTPPPPVDHTNICLAAKKIFCASKSPFILNEIHNDVNKFLIKEVTGWLPAADIVSIGSLSTDKPIKQDIANWCTRLVLGTGGADLLDNEAELVADILSKDTELFSSMKRLLELHGGTPASPRNNDPDSATADSTTTASNNYARQVLLSGLANNATAMVDRINTEISARGGTLRDVTEFMPINPQPGDTLILYVAYGSNNELRLGSAGGSIVSPALETTYLSNLASSSTLFTNGSVPHTRYHDGTTDIAKAWHVYQVTLTFT